MANDSNKTDASDDVILKVDGLKTYFFTDDGVLPSVDGVSFEIKRGRTLGLVGESGSGKSVTSLSVLRLIPQPPGKIVDGQILFGGQDLTKLTEAQMRKVRGNDISMIFQEPMTSLNPVFTVGNQIIEAILLHQDMEYAEAREYAIDMLEKVGIPAPEQRIDEYPHQMSGGMKQRVMIAMALSSKPKLLIADEPTTALDVTIQAQILELLKSLQAEGGMSILFITHDLGVVAETCDDVAVMYAGRIVEYGDVYTVFEKPAHPYTIGLFNSLPTIDTTGARGRDDRLYVIPGMVPRPQDFPSGCRFRTRCKFATEKCSELPPTVELEPGHTAACWYAEKVRAGTQPTTDGSVAADGSVAPNEDAAEVAR
ncbi:ABC transporter ATP-binding protein [Lujinxingia vulgaris]|uniref:ABC transporter ATP-binding protein n=1 Tax=Lujinxingia vulgaris TaxID=2600176 RepID=A0A5C6XG05_9DELT|nr:ABC transporter ATP-binding protein [Lujinxingia vulgaris]TXD39383.1 ABC transporter ATP-binding protein [Lujinxingia vulgaris]